MEYKDVVFYNHFGTGDLWASREFVRVLIDLIDADNYYYAHAKDHHIFFDIPNLIYKQLDDKCLLREPYVICGNTLYINTWIGWAYGKYVFPGVSVTLDNYKRMFNDALHSLGATFQFCKNNFDYVPKPDYRFLKDEYVDNVNRFVFQNMDKTLVLISNGEVQSNQAFNFDFMPIISELAVTYEDSILIITEDYLGKPENVYLANDIIGKTEGTELPEISYLSQYVDIIIGRSSGPFVFAQTVQNYSNPDMSLLSFTYEKQCSHMLKEHETVAKLFWSPDTDHDNILNKIKEVIGVNNE